MRVIKFNPVPVKNSHKFMRLEAEVVDRPLIWCIKNSVMPIPDDIDPGPIEADNIPAPLFDNWKSFGQGANGRSAMLPSAIDLNVHHAAHSELRLYGTINMIEYLDGQEFEKADVGLRGFLQMLLMTNYVKASCSFDDLISDAEASLKVWDKDAIYAFIAKVLGKNATAVTVADVAQVVHVLTGETIDISKENFDIMNVVQYLTTAVAIEERPDEFFTAAYPQEIMEYEIMTSIVAIGDDEALYFGRGAKFTPNWGVTGPESVRWKAIISTANNKVQFAPMAGTMFDRALASKQKMFPGCNDTIPFTLSLDDKNVMDVLSGDKYRIDTADFNTGVRYMTVRQELPIYKVTLVPVEAEKIVDELSRIASVNMPQDPTIQDVVDAFVKLYKAEEKGIDAAFDDKHFMVFDTLEGMASGELGEDLVSKAVNADRVDNFTLVGNPQNVRAIVQYIWVLMHMMTDSLCYRAAANDDFTVESAVEYALNLCLKSKKTISKYLMTCAYSDGFGRATMGTREVVDMDKGIDFSVF